MIKMIAKRLWRYFWILFCVLCTGIVSAERTDVSMRGRIENRSYLTRCTEVDNVNIPLYAQHVPTLRITATHPTYLPAPMDMRGADHTNCAFYSDRLWRIGREDGSSAEFDPVGAVSRHVFFVADRPPAGKDMPSAAFPRAIGAGTVTDQFIHFTADEDSDTNIELKIGADLRINMAALEGPTNTKQLTLRCMTWDGAGWQNHGDRTFTPSGQFRVWNIPDSTWIEGTDRNIIYLHVVSAEEGGETSPGTRALYDYVELKRRDVLGQVVLPPLISNAFIEVVPVRLDLWWRYPESMTVQVVGGPMVTNVHYVRIRKREPDSDPPRLNDVFVLYEDGNARLVPLPPEQGVEWVPFGASVLLGPSDDGHRPAAAIDKIVVDPKDLSLEVHYEGGSVVHIELWSDETQTVVDVTGLTSPGRDEPIARLRSMWVYDGNADVDRIRSAMGTFPILHSWSVLDGSWWQFATQVPSYHNTYSPDLRIEILDPSLAYHVWEAEDLREGHGVQPQVNLAASSSQTLRVLPQGGEVIYRIRLDRPQPATQMRLRYADADGIDVSTHRGNAIRVEVDGELAASTYTTDTGGWDDFEMAPGLYLGDLDPGEHSLKLIIGPGSQGVQLDQFALVSQPIQQRRMQKVLSIEAEELSAGQGFSPVSHDQASGRKTIRMDAKGGNAIFLIEVPEAIEEAYLTLHYSDIMGPNTVQVFVDGEIAAKFPTWNTQGWNDFITSPELFIGQLRAGQHEIRFVTSPGTLGVNLDRFAIFSR